MIFQLVLQFAGDALADYDKMITLEDRLIADLADSADVDGHDCGSGEVNIFIVTSDPLRIFDRAKDVLRECGALDSVTAAYRPEEGNDYSVIWPEGAQIEFSVT
jgi:hypothetical protein